MKNSLITFLLLLLFVRGTSQNFNFEHTGGRAAIISHAKLSEAKLTSEILPNYSSYWNSVIDHVTVQISGTCNGKEMTSSGSSDTLNQEQSNILANADMGSDIMIRIRFTFKDAAGYDTESKTCGHRKIEELEYALTPGPDISAEFPGGYPELSDYLKEKVIDKVSETITIEEINRITVAFLVDENGEITNAQVYRTSANAAADRLVLEAIAKMPRWKPAEFPKGKKVKQKFILGVGGAGC